MDSNIINVLNKLNLLLKKYCKTFEDCLSKSNQQGDPQAVMMLSGVHHGICSLDAIRILLQVDPEKAFCAASLARCIFEASIRLLWATRTLSGSHEHWARLQKYWALEDKKWADQAKRFPQTSQHAEQIEISRSEIFDNDITPAPPIEQMLKDIDKADRKQKLKANEGIAEFIYTNCYRVLCRASHAHPAALRQEAISNFVGQVRIACILATNWYCQAICHVAGDNENREVEKVIEQILQINNRKC